MTPTTTITRQGPGRVRSTEDLQALALDAAERFRDASADEVLAWAAETFGQRLVVACSMAAPVVPHLAARHRPGVDVLFMQTGYHFAETIGTRDALEHAVDVRVIDALPLLTVAEQDAQYGPRLYERDPQACCAIRKVEPTDRELSGYEAWVTGVRRSDNPLRARAGIVEWDAAREMVKLNPIAAWTTDEIMAYAGEHGIPVNPLLDEGYPSIGCAPCTRPVAPGEDPRSGRWAGFAKTECGMHGAPGAA